MKQKYFCFISTDATLDGPEKNQKHTKKWYINVFQVCKDYQNLRKEYKAMSNDAMVAHIAVVF